MSLRDGYPAASLEAGMSWNCDENPVINPHEPVQVIGHGSPEWSAPLSASAVRWQDVRRWRFALKPEPTTPAPYPHPEDGAPWNSPVPPSTVPDRLVQIKVADANDWSVPMRPATVHWRNVVRWRYASLQVPTTPDTKGDVCGACVHAKKDSREDPCKSCSEHETFGAFERAPTPAALDIQVGGAHYKSFKIQPVEYIHANGLDYLQGNVVKYVSRHKSKHGAEDVRKAIHYLELILQLQYGEGKNA